MEFDWNQEQRRLYAEMREFAEHELNEGIIERDRAGEFCPASWKKCAAQGVQGLFVPKAYGGGGHDVVTTIAALEGLGYGCRDNGLTLGLNGQMWSVQAPLLTFGSEEQKERFLPAMCRGDSLAAHGMTEPETGSDAFNLKTTAREVEGGYLLDGHKWLIGLGPVCDLALVFATVNPKLGKWGVTAFLVENKSDGFEVGAAEDKIGLRTGPLGRITLTECFVPEANRLGPEGAGVSLFNHSMLWERAFIFASHVGSMHRQLDEAEAFAGKRSVFGGPIRQHQSVSNRLADMKVRMELSRLLLYKAAWSMDVEKSDPGLSAMAKLYISEAFVQNSIDAMRTHGGRSCLTEYGIERDLRDAIGGVIYSGTSDIQRQVIAQLGDLSVPPAE